MFDIFTLYRPLWCSVDPRHLHKRLFNPAAQSDRSTAVGLTGTQQEDPSGHGGSEQRENEEGAHHNFHSGVQGLPYGGKGDEFTSCGGRGCFWGVVSCLVIVNCRLFVSQYSQMRDELFKSNMVCSFILLLLLMAVQALIPAPRYTCQSTWPSTWQYNMYLITLVSSICGSGFVRWWLSSWSAAVFTSCSCCWLWGRSLSIAPPPCSPSAAGFMKPRASGRCSHSPPSPSTSELPPQTLWVHNITQSPQTFLSLAHFLSSVLFSFLPSLQLWCDSSDTHINSSDSQLAPPTSTWPAVNICTHPEVSVNVQTARKLYIIVSPLYGR